MGRRARFRAHARRRQLHDRRGGAAHGAHHAGRSEARDRAEPGGRAAVDQRLRAAVPVRHAARHALLHDRERVVAGRLRTLLGPQRAAAARALHRALRSARSAGHRHARRPDPQPRSDRGGADAARRLRGSGAALRAPELRGEPGDAARVHPPRPALVPRQHAVLAPARPARHQAGQPLPARLRDPDVFGLAAWIGLLVVGTFAAATAPAGFIRPDAAWRSRRDLDHVAVAQARDLDRRADAAEGNAGPSAVRRASW